MIDDLKVYVQREDELRYKILLFIYRETGGNTRAYFSDWDEDIFPQLSIERAEGLRAIEYLKGEGLLKAYGQVGVYLTHQGVVEVERSIKNPKQETEHFSVNVIQNVFNASVTAVQVGDGNTVKS